MGDNTAIILNKKKTLKYLGGRNIHALPISGFSRV